jgi:tetratricopeptide (TPR) repeat protein
MSPKLVLSALLALIIWPVYGEGSDSLKVSSLKFNSQQEEEILREAISGKVKNHFHLYHVISHAEGHKIDPNQQLFEQKLSEINRPKLEKLSRGKKVKFLYETIHKSLLKKYELKNEFSEIFSEGKYNCVSACALYSLVFDYFDIPYKIVETPDHVYMITYPDEDKIIVETTMPEGGNLTLDAKFRENFVRQLAKQKLISQEEIQIYSTIELFEKYYLNQKTISTIQLAGLQYFNAGLFSIDDKNHAQATEYLEIAYALYPESEKIKAFLTYSLAHQIDELKYSKVEDAELLLRFYHLHKEENGNSVTLKQFHRIYERVFIRNNNQPLFDAFYNRIIMELEEGELKEDISFKYYYEIARSLLTKGKYTEALPHAEVAYQLRPNDQNAQNLILHLIGRKVSLQADMGKNLGYLEELTVQLPDLKNNNLFISLLAEVNLSLFGEEYYYERPAKGELYRQKFEELLESYPNLEINETSIGRSYSTAAVYHFRKNNVAKARQYIEKGLQFAPGNFELLQRKLMIK